VMCSYRLLASNRAAPNRLDVRFTPQLVPHVIDFEFDS